MKSSIPTDLRQDRIMPLIAEIFIHPVEGRIIGLVGLVLPIVLFIVELPGSDYGRLGLLMAVLTIPGIILAFILHELGHIIVLRYLGARACFYWKLPFDMRSLIKNDHPIFSNDIFLIRRALAGTLVNLGLVFSFLIGSWILSSPILAFLAFFQGFSSLAATAWSANTLRTDAGSLRKALALDDTIEVQSTREGKNLDVKIKGYIRKREKLEPSYWLLFTGFWNLSLNAVQGSFVVMDDPEFNTVLVILRSLTDMYSFRVQGEVVCEVWCISKCGTSVRISENTHI